MGGGRRAALRRLLTDALLAASATVIFIIEAQIPLPVPVPGFRLGLANIFTICAAFAAGPLDAAGVLAVRILLGNLFAGQPVAMIYSAAGGVLCLAVTLILRRVLTGRQIWVSGALGALAHTAGQTLCAVVMFGTWSVAAYFPLAAAMSVAAGVFTGLAAQFAVAAADRRR